MENAGGNACMHAGQTIASGPKASFKLLDQRFSFSLLSSDSTQDRGVGSTWEYKGETLAVLGVTWEYEGVTCE